MSVGAWWFNRGGLVEDGGVDTAFTELACDPVASKLRTIFTARVRDGGLEHLLDRTANMARSHVTRFLVQQPLDLGSDLVVVWTGPGEELSACTRFEALGLIEQLLDPLELLPCHRAPSAPTRMTARRSPLASARRSANGGRIAIPSPRYSPKDRARSLFPQPLGPRQA